MRLGYDFEYLNQNQPRIGTNPAAVGEIPGDHNEVGTINRIHRLSASAGLTDRLSVDLQLPFISRTHRHIDNDTGMPVLEGWGFTGVGDLLVQTRYIFWKPPSGTLPTLSLILGGKFPTGKTRITNDDGAEAEPGILPGSGSYDLMVGGSSLQTLNAPMVTGAYAELPLFFSLTYRFNGRGVKDYKIGNILLANVGVTYPVLRRVGVITQINLRVSEQDDRGSTTEEVEKTGGEYIYVSPGIAFTLAKGWEASALVQIPIHQRVNRIQVTPSYNLLTRMSYRFRI